MDPAQGSQELIDDCKWYSILGIHFQWKSTGKVQVFIASAYTEIDFVIEHKMNSFYQPYIDILRNPRIVKIGMKPEKEAKKIKDQFGIIAVATMDVRFFFPEGKNIQSICTNILNLDDEPAKAAVRMFYAHAIKYHYGEEWLHILSEIIPILDVPFCIYRNKHQKGPTKMKTKYLPLDEQCYIHAPDGTLLKATTRVHAKEFIRKAKAVPIGMDTDTALECLRAGSRIPINIKLLNWPKNFPQNHKQLDYNDIRRDRCVVCMDTENCLNHNVVPKRYRKWFPRNAIPNPGCGDTGSSLYLCLNCHLEAEEKNKFLQNALERHCNVDRNKNLWLRCKGVADEYIAKHGHCWVLEAVWKTFFMASMNPKCVPLSWKEAIHVSGKEEMRVIFKCDFMHSYRAYTPTKTWPFLIDDLM